MSNPPQDPRRKPLETEPEVEETAAIDDAIIGRAIKKSFLILVVLITFVGGAWFFLHRPKAAAPTQVTPLSAPVVAAKPTQPPPKVSFVDITSSAGISFHHNNGAVGEKLLPETMGGGVAFLDYDADGAPDLLLINSTWWPGKTPSGQSPTTAALYHNDGKGHFTDVTAGSGLDIPIYGMGVAVGDYDNDGRVDVFITGVGGNHLFHNEGQGKFKEATALAGVGGDPSGWSTAATWVDIDNDGDLDLFVANYVRWSRDIDFEVGFKIDGVTRAYGPPMNFAGTFPILYRNDGQGKFTDISADSGIQKKNVATGVPAAKSLGVAPVDINGDGWIDLIIANDTTPNMVFTNTGHSTFVEVGQVSGIAFDSYGNTRGAMGIDVARYRNDSTLGVVIGNFANEMIALYTSQNDPSLFTDSAISEGIGPASRLPLKFGVFFFDYDLDGRLDVLSANGHLEEEISKIQKSQRYRQPAQLFWNNGAESGGCFVEVSSELAGADLFKPLVGRGSAYADIDGDGDEDVVLTQIGAAPLLLRNDQATGNHWLRFILTGTKANRDAIGAWIRVTVGKTILARQVMPTRSYLSQSALPVTFGLGKAAQVDSVEILWPGGGVQKLSAPKVDSVLRITQP